MTEQQKDNYIKQLERENKSLKAQLKESENKLCQLATYISSGSMKRNKKSPSTKSRIIKGLSLPQRKAVLMAGVGFLELGQGEVNLNHFYYGGNMPIKTEEDKERGFGEVEEVKRRTVDAVIKKGLAYFENGVVEVYLTEKGEKLYRELLALEGYIHPPKRNKRRLL